MDLAHVPWKDGLEAVLGIVLLKILYDCVYVKIPIGFKGVRRMLAKQTERGNERHAEHLTKMASLESAVKNLETKKCRGATRRAAAKKKRPAS